MLIKSRLQHYLAANGMTASGLARASGIPKQCISDWLAGVKPRSLTQVKRIADTFGVSMDEFLFGVREPSRASQVDVSSICSFVLDSESRFLDASGAFVALLGWEKNEILGTRFVDYIHVHDLERACHLHDDLVRKKAQVENIDLRLVTKARQIKWLRIRSAVLTHSFIHAIAEDVSKDYPRLLPETYQARLRPFISGIANQAYLLEASQFDSTEEPAPPLVATLPENVLIEVDSLLKGALIRVFSNFLKAAHISKTTVGVECRHAPSDEILLIKIQAPVSLSELKRDVESLSIRCAGPYVFEIPLKPSTESL